MVNEKNLNKIESERIAKVLERKANIITLHMNAFGTVENYIATVIRDSNSLRSHGEVIYIDTDGEIILPYQAEKIAKNVDAFKEFLLKHNETYTSYDKELSIMYPIEVEKYIYFNKRLMRQIGECADLTHAKRKLNHLANLLRQYKMYQFNDKCIEPIRSKTIDQEIMDECCSHLE